MHEHFLNNIYRCIWFLSKLRTKTHTYIGYIPLLDNEKFQTCTLYGKLIVITMISIYIYGAAFKNENKIICMCTLFI